MTSSRNSPPLGKATDCGGLAYLNDLAQSVPSAANLRRYAEIVRERAILRRLVTTRDEIATAALARRPHRDRDPGRGRGKIFRIGEEGHASSEAGLPVHGPARGPADRPRQRTGREPRRT